MAKNDVKIVNAGGRNVLPTVVYRTEGGSTAINAGEPVGIGGTGTNYVHALSTGEPTATAFMLGIAANDSNHTASADGTVEVYVITPDIILECAAHTAGNIDTDAKLLALLNDRVTFDLTSGTYTVDEDQGDDPVNGLRIVDGNIDAGTLQFRLQLQASSLNATA